MLKIMKYNGFRSCCLRTTLLNDTVHLTEMKFSLGRKKPWGLSIIMYP